jgi:ectoine hydroxylase-related dioxygenase (phytanoyl-CoA dioxygenase family)
MMRTIPAPVTTAEAVLHDPPDAAALAAYERVGAIVVRGLIEPAWIRSLRDDYDRMAELGYDPATKGVRSAKRELVMRYGMWREEESFRAFLFGSTIARAAAALMRSRTATLYEDLLITEPAGAGRHNGWHQDEPSWPVSGRMLSSVWLSLEPVDAESGAIRFVEASHRGPLYQPRYVTAEEVGEDVLLWTGGLLPDVDDDPGATAVLTDAQPGDAVIFHPRAIHAALGSAKSHARRTFTIRFLGDDVRWLPKHRMFHPWMRDLGLSKGDEVVSPRLPRVWDADAQAAA